MASRESRSALIAIIMFAVGAVLLRILSWAQDEAHVTRQTEAVLRLIVGSTILLTLIYYGARPLIASLSWLCTLAAGPHFSGTFSR